MLLLAPLVLGAVFTGGLVSIGAPFLPAVLGIGAALAAMFLYLSVHPDVPAAFEWFWSRDRVVRSFRVEGHRLVVESPGFGPTEVDLRGAEIRASELGVFVLSRGQSVELYWDDADLESATRLANALRGVATPEGGTPADVPPSLRQLAVG